MTSAMDLAPDIAILLAHTWKNHNGETKIASPPVQPPMRQPTFKINVLLIEPNEKNARFLFRKMHF